MKIHMLKYDDELILVTAHGTKVCITVTEVKLKLGEAGKTDQIDITTEQSIAVKHYPNNPAGSPLHGIRVGVDHYPTREKNRASDCHS